MCVNSILDALTGPDRNADGIGDSYQGPWLADGRTASGYLYPVWDTRDAGDDDDMFLPWMTLSHSLHNRWTARKTGTGTTTLDKIEQAITAECAAHTDCEKRSRCVYSLRVFGYFWESTTCGAGGDPMGACGGAICGDGTCQDTENACTCSTDCGAASCGDGICCATDNETCTSCASDCAPSGGSRGFACTRDSDCESGLVCQGGTCSSCDDDRDCDGRSNDCIKPDGCLHYYCSESEECVVPDTCSATAGCGDGTCAGAEDTCSCPADCGPDGCGNGVCCAAGGEDCTSCIADCGVQSGGLADDCSSDRDCNGGLKCRNSICSLCGSDRGCESAFGRSSDCDQPAGCAHYLCVDGSSTHTCQVPDSCLPPAAICGNGVCESGEDACTCAGDCGGTCGDGLCCAATENCSTCAADCMPAANGLGRSCSRDSDCASNHCLNGACSTCEDGGDCWGRNNDCVQPATCAHAFCDDTETCQVAAACLPVVCGDNNCAPSEDCTSCNTDCGPAANGLGRNCTRDSDCASGTCNNGVCSTCAADDDCDGRRNDCVKENGCSHYHCEDNDACQFEEACVPVVCGDGFCRGNETSCSCAADCGAGSCGDGTCCAASGETWAACARDCTPPDGELGSGCRRDSSCDSNNCEGGICSLCNDDSDCGRGGRCRQGSGCAHFYCTSGGGASTNHCEVFLGGGGGGGGDAVEGALTPAELEACEASSANGGRDARDVGGGGGGGGGAIAGTAIALAQAVPAQWSGTTTSGPVYLSNLFNFYPPKGIALVRVFKDTVVNMVGDARIGVTDFDDVGRNGAVKFPIGPTCSATTGALVDECFDGTSATRCFDPTNATLINYLNNVLDFSDSTPLAKALDNAGKYMSIATGDPAICDYTGVTTCGDPNSFVVMITDGYPTTDATQGSNVPYANSLVSGLSSSYAVANNQWVDDVARVLRDIDHRSNIDGPQIVKTYTVSFGLVDDAGECVGLLNETAASGGGRCLPAASVEALRTALNDIVVDIIRKALGFTSPALPTTRYAGTSTLASAVFRPSTSYPLWEGHSFGFKVCDEAAGRETNSTCDCFSGADVNEVCVESTDGQAIAYDNDGYLTVRPYWDVALCLAGDAAGSLGAEAPDQSNLDVSACYRTADERSITTAVPGVANPLTTLTSADQVAFTAASVASVASFYTELGVPTVADGQTLVEFYRGKDSSDADGDLNTTEDRNLNTIRSGTGDLVDGWWKLGDIFHSFPNIVERPSGRGLGAWALSQSYRTYAADNATRTRVLLVGANDGMLHAFQAGAWDADLGFGEGAYDVGTGEELWGFVSPELVSRLKNTCAPASGGCDVGQHQFMVDGSVMVRDIWIGGNADKENPANKVFWKTVAIYGHRDGGSTYVGLDVTDIDSPVFLWQFPQPGSADEALMGKTWLDVFPSPASIGPVRWDHDGDSGTAVVDRWLAFVSGGFDQKANTGNALFGLDAYTGAVLWRSTQVAATSTELMDYSFPATPVFYSDMSATLPYVNGLVVPDQGGQLWHVPTPAAALSAGVFTYAPELVFTTLPAASRVVSDGDATLEAAEYQRRPLFFAPTLTRNMGKVRAIFATGDRDMLVPDSDVAAAIGNYGCNDEQRLYAIDIERCPTNTGTRPCTEADLQAINIASGTYASVNQRGWYYVLPAGEKSAAPYDVFGGYGLYSIFAPTGACGGGSASASACTYQAKGRAKLYSLHYISGKPLDWDGDNVIEASDAFVELGQGVPTAPAVSVSVTGSGANPTLFVGGSDSGLTSRPLAVPGTDLVVELLRFHVNRQMHAVLHE